MVEDILVLRNNPGFASAAVALPLAVSICLPVASAVASVEDWQHSHLREPFCYLLQGIQLLLHQDELSSSLVGGVKFPVIYCMSFADTESWRYIQFY